jgi:hypothetical protein
MQFSPTHIHLWSFGFQTGWAVAQKPSGDIMCGLGGGFGGVKQGTAPKIRM